MLVAAHAVQAVATLTGARVRQVAEIATYSDYKGVIAHHKENTGLPVVVDFFSHSCGPCRQIAPEYSRLAKQYAGKAVFIKVDVNRNSQASQVPPAAPPPPAQWPTDARRNANSDGGGAGHADLQVLLDGEGA